MALVFLSGCSRLQTKPLFQEANDLFSKGSYQASLDKYGEISRKDPAAGDRVLFEMGMIHAHPKNERKDYQRAFECFEKIVMDYPESGYRKDSEMMMFYINTVTVRDKTIAEQEKFIASQQARIEALQQELKRKKIEAENEIQKLREDIKALEQKRLAFILANGSADRIQIEKKERRLTLYSKGEVIKAYRIALGGNPNGPKERQGDNKTPEGTYYIASRNRDSQYHLSLHISYPNETDKKRAKELGVSPGGNIMIHGIKKGFSWVGDMHTGLDWTKGCIAVTDEEIEEIAKLASNGTVVEIKP
ncbi:L,D-transpeptidase family protein [Geobacter sp. DSM 9736]|uniref:L,D-transpeptidase family protein n=1 Tax=Geobacter sp. DSM 9736 TaxID=1277350 RepID=UPI0026F445BA|nr:L,D-transpeptidase family protein [Geobacter sp. DSM 9736]